MHHAGDVLLHAGGPEAEAGLLEELHDFPHNTRARAALATLYQAIGQTEGAARVESDLVRITPTRSVRAGRAALDVVRQSAAGRAVARTPSGFTGRRTAH